MTNNPFITGKGTVVRVSPLQGNRVAPIAQTITLNGAAVANANSLTVEALTGKIDTSAELPVYVNFTDADGNESLVKITADAIATATTLTVAALDKAIADNATAELPVKLLARTAANISTNSSDTTSTTFDTGAYEDGLMTSIGYGVSCPGNFLSQDAGWRTCFQAFNELKEVWLEVALPKPAGYSKGYVFKGPASVTNCALDIPADGVITSPVDFKFRGKITIVEPTV